MNADPFADVSLFIATARAGSFTKASEKLGVTKSAVGKAIARLEKNLGFQLFNRTTRVTRLTADGEAYLSVCVSALDEISAARIALSTNNRILSGRVHLDMPVAFGRRILLPRLIEIIRPHPDLNLALTFSDATSDLLRDDVDIAIRFGEVKNSSHLVARHLATQQRVICAAPRYLKLYGAPKTLEDIPSHRCIVGSVKGPPMRWNVMKNNVQVNITPPQTYQFSDGEAMVDAGIAGLGLVQLPDSLVRPSIKDGQLSEVLFDFATTVEVHAIWKHQAQMSPRVRYVIDKLISDAANGKFI
jgi:DNA-binding transcriptional LysR family regulator